ncbi:M10 family metallopeptidase C-terminal domain-containing protein [Aureimonas leprariae]|uniref:M10 family metallopeptidase C-terminal domain-containing protein n=1 Tax=Plantimonas leprariae TaxID=2615207 RepID=UPI00192A5BB8|nr:M10 family metallopeptidase C-terminal domain-containing protein [Aureimonas leprariae]
MSNVHSGATAGAGGSESVPPSGKANIDALLAGTRWTDTDLTYSFPTQGALYSYYPKGGFEYSTVRGPWHAQHVTFTAAQAEAVRSTLDMVASATGLSFTEVAESATNHATLRFSQLKTVYDSDAPPIQDFDSTMFHGPGAKPESGDAWFDQDSFFFGPPNGGNFGTLTIMRGVAEGLGLAHSGQSFDFSILSGSAHWFDYGSTDRMPQTLMQNDIAALQHLYGADYTTHAGDTTYSWSQATGESFVDGVGQGAPGRNFIYGTVWDGGGTDTYDLSNYTSDLDVDLAPGAFSTFSAGQLGGRSGFTAAGNVANALLHDDDPRSLIENAVGGSGNDRIAGNVAANVLTGNAGSDTLSGREGNDTLDGGSGNDALLGGAGNDTLKGGSGNDILIGDNQPAGIGFGSGSIAWKVDTNATAFERALDISNSFSITDDPFVTDSGTVPHVTIHYSAEKTAWTPDYYKVHLNAGTTLIMDVDGLGNAYNNIAFYDAAKTQLAYTYTYSRLDPGTTAYGDSFLIYTVEKTGDYYIQHGSIGKHDLHISAEGPAPQIGLGSGTVDKPASLVLSGPDLNFDSNKVLDLTSSFSLAANADIADSTTVPHVTVNASTGENGVDFYHVRLTAGSVLTLDIDATGGRATNTNLRLYDLWAKTGDGFGFAYNDDMGGPLDPGSASASDSFLTYTIKHSGDYYIRVDNYYNTAYTYQLHVSVKEPAFGPGGAGDDTLQGGAGDDTLVGGAGRDTAVYDGNRADYVISQRQADGSITVTGKGSSAGDGTDRLFGVEAARFKDGTVDLAAGKFTPTDPSYDAPKLVLSGVAAGGSGGVVVTLGGQALAGKTVEFFDGAAKLGSTSVDNSGRFALTLSELKLPAGAATAELRLTARIADGSGTSSPASDPVVVEVGTGAGLAAKLSSYAATGGLAAVFITDGSNLVFGSKAALDTARGDYAAVLAKVVGPYTLSVETTDAAGQHSDLYLADGTLRKSVLVAPDGALKAAGYAADGKTKITEYAVHDGVREEKHFAVTGKPYAREDAVYDAATNKPLAIDRYDANGRHVFSDVFAADRSHAVTEWLANGDTQVRNYDAKSRLTAERLSDGDGTLVRTQALAANGSGETHRFDRDTGVERSATLTAADGSRVEKLVNVASQAYVERDSHYGANGKLLFIDQRTADGSHAQFAKAAGQVLVSHAGVADAFTAFKGGADAFVFAQGSGRDTVAGFQAGSGANHDVLRIDDSYASNFADLSGRITKSGADTLISLAAGDTILLKTIAPATLTTENFLFQHHDTIG